MDTLSKSNLPLYIAAIGASAGGHEALNDFFANIPPNPQIAFVVIMHLKRDYESKLDTILRKHTSLRVIKLQGNEKLATNTVYVLPENYYATVKNDIISLQMRDTEDPLNTAIDVFFQSLGENSSTPALGIIFSGMGIDGSKGILSIEKNGGTIAIQSPETAQFKMMPTASILADHPDYVASPAEIGRNILNIISIKKDAAVGSPAAGRL